LRAHGVTVASIAADVAKAEEVQRVIDGTLAALGRIDILVNNAGTAWLDHTLSTTDEQWQYCMELNLFSAVRFTRGVAPHLRKQGGGRIINISTVGAHTPPPILPDYDSAKAAMLETTRLLHALCGNQLMADRFLGVWAGTVPIPEFFASDNVRQLL
jgi:NAD(P)-dependent dehydrogenase (short-subunit alcohol dehydrogenase family)